MSVVVDRLANVFSLRVVLITAFSLLVGCSSAPHGGMPMINHYAVGSAQNADGGDIASLADQESCRTTNSMFNHRQLWIAPSAVQSAWFSCVRYSGGAWFPEEDENTRGDWTDRPDWED
jgi:hypothetical protein